MSLYIKNLDITKIEVDCIVNAANIDLLMGGGVCYAIFKASNHIKELQAECLKLAPIKTGEAIITNGYDLKAKHIIHTAGPIYHDYRPNEAQYLLEQCYLNSLKLAQKYNCKSIAFPLISSGIYGYPPKKALEVAKDTINKFLATNEMEVYLLVLDNSLL
ncbi:MAG: macro domain-containing protein [Bacilli bacterium]|jgi:O-acetyl-ADP-ribose deacetylase (regulator of RNase III)|nr:macro domain-containing protein [Bacilli bacterium]